MSGGTPKHLDPDDLEGIAKTGEWLGIGNEFTGVQVRKVWTRNGERLQLWVPARNYTILLDAMQLEIVAAQDPSEFSTLFARKLGSGDMLGGQEEGRATT